MSFCTFAAPEAQKTLYKQRDAIDPTNGERYNKIRRGVRRKAGTTFDRKNGGSSD